MNKLKQFDGNDVKSTWTYDEADRKKTESVEALQAGGASYKESRSLVAQSLWNLRKQGAFILTRIPWYSKK